MPLMPISALAAHLLLAPRRTRRSRRGHQGPRWTPEPPHDGKVHAQPARLKGAGYRHARGRSALAERKQAQGDGARPEAAKKAAEVAVGVLVTEGGPARSSREIGPVFPHR
jgi:hypothetical protein